MKTLIDCECKILKRFCLHQPAYKKTNWNKPPFSIYEPFFLFHLNYYNIEVTPDYYFIITNSYNRNLISHIIFKLLFFFNTFRNCICMYYSSEHRKQLSSENVMQKANILYIGWYAYDTCLSARYSFLILNLTIFYINFHLKYFN